MLKRPFKSLIARIAIIALALSLVVPFVPAAFAQDTSLSYAENGTGPVANFFATDQDGDPIEWSLSGADANRFTIGGGVLAFKKSPDYEKPTSAVTGGTQDEQNVYNVTLEATGGSHDVAIQVTNVDEAGSVSFDKPQAQAGRGLVATLTDQDDSVSDEEWRWERSEDGETWADIEGATAQSRSPASADVGSYLRATVTYTDLFGSGKTVSGVTATKVESRTVANAAPSFADQDDDTTTDDIEVGRGVAENSSEGAGVGKPISATDSDSDALIYTLEDGNMVPDPTIDEDGGAPAGTIVHDDNDTDDKNNSKDGDSRHFTIDRSTGQIKVKNDKLNFETPVDVVLTVTDDEVTTEQAEASLASRNTYLVTVIAKDPSGAAKTQLVTITVGNVNEAPAFGLADDVPTVVRVRENGTILWSGATGMGPLAAAYAADDEDAVDQANTEDPPQGIDHDNVDSTETVTVVYSVEGTDKKYFTINTVDVIVDGGDPFTPGTLMISPDPDDEGLSVVNLDDYKPNYEAKDSYSIIIAAASGDGSRRLTTRLPVTVNVLDGDDDGTVSVSQREPQVGRTVIATVSDPDGGVTITDWAWENAALPAVNDNTTGETASCRALPRGDTVREESDTEFGPLATDWAPVKDDPNSAAYTPTSDDIGKCLRATVTYTDNIKNVDDPLTDEAGQDESADTQVMLVTEKTVQRSDPANTAPLFGDQDPTTAGDQSDKASRTIAENTPEGESIGAPVTAEDTDLLLYSLSGPDAASFKIDDNGQLTTKGELDYEAKATYTVVVTASDPSSAADGILVTINVSDEDDPADIGGASALDYAENGIGPVATFSADDQDGDPIVWSLSGADANRFTIEGGELAFKKSPDYEKPNSAVTGGTRAEQNVYNVKIEAAGGSHDVAVTVTNVDEAGSVSFNRPQPQSGRGLVASLADQDGGVSDEEWQWARSEDGETWADIDGATAQSRSPAAADVGSYLQATVIYTDLFDSGKTVSGVTANKVEAKTVANAAPSFADQDDDTTTDDIEVGRGVAENSSEGAGVGKPVSATDSDSDVLIYTLEDGNMVLDETTEGDITDMRHHDTDTDAKNNSKDGDSKHFTIDRTTGQIKVKNDKLDFEAVPRTDVVLTTDSGATEDEAEASAESTNTYLVTVIAKDPSGAAKAQLVTITVGNVNEAPTFGLGEDVPTVVRVRENGTDLLRGESGMVELGVAYLAGDLDADDIPEVDTVRGIDHDNMADTPRVNVVYSVEGTDKKYFTIANIGDLDDGVQIPVGTLSISPDPDDEGLSVVNLDDYKPNYEAKDSYSIVIAATSGDGSRRLTTRLAVTVNVSDGEDDGTVSVSQREPQVGRTVIATVSDPDGGVTITDWAWENAALPAVNDNTTGETASCRALPRGDTVREEGDTEFGPLATDWAPVKDDPNSAAYTPTSDDIGKCLRATVTYTDNIKNVDDPLTDEAGQDESADTQVMLVTEKTVQRSDPANTAPLFGDQDPTTAGDQSDKASRTIAENTPEGESIGAPVTAEDTDLLLYSLSGPDAASFKIDDNGQLTTKGELDYEAKATHTVVVTASDPSGAADGILVTINVTDEDDGAAIELNEAPAFAEDPADLSVEENSAAGTAVGDPVTATDTNAGDSLTYALSGDDAGSFSIDASGQISVGADAALDFESQASYTVTVTATDKVGATDSITVTINVTNVNEAPVASGEAAVDYAENGTDPVGTYMASDPDGDTITWALSGADAASFSISEDGMLSFAAAPAIEEEASDANGEDANGAEANGEGMNGAEANGEGMNGAEANGEGMNGAEANGEGMNGAEANGEGMNGAEANGEGMNGAEANGEGMNDAETVSSPDYEAPGDADGDNVYEVTVIATDSSGATDSVMVSVTVTDVDENNAPAFAADSADLNVAENSEAMAAVGDPVVATDADGDEITYTISEDSGFEIWPSGQITVAEGTTLDYESEVTSYSVTVTATDPSGASGSIDVTINVTDVEENNAPAFEADAVTFSVDENAEAMAAVGDPVVATDADEDELTYALSGDGAAAFEIWPSGQITVAEGAALDYESDTTSYSVTVTATDPSGASDSVDVTINVNNVGLMSAYDSDDSGDISKDEAVKAVQDYFEDTITRGEALEVLQLYFAG